MNRSRARARSTWARRRSSFWSSSSIWWTCSSCSSAAIERAAAAAGLSCPATVSTGTVAGGAPERLRMPRDLAAGPARAASGLDLDFVDDAEHTGGGPGRAMGGVALGPRIDAAAQRHDRAIDDDLDVLGLVFRV